MRENNLQDLIKRAENLLSYRPQSIYEMRLKLRRSRAPQELIDKALENLIQSGQLDDLQFSRWWVGQRTSFKPCGNKRLRFELRQKGIDRGIIEQALLTPEQEAELAKKIPTEKRLSRGFPAVLPNCS
jgi:regulatory protein